MDISPKGDWVPVLGAQQHSRRECSRTISKSVNRHFCELANKEASNVVKSRYGTLQLQYWMQSEKYCIILPGDWQGNRKLSPSAASFTPAVVYQHATTSEKLAESGNSDTNGPVTNRTKTVMEPSTSEQSPVRIGNEGGEEEGIHSTTPKERLHDQISRDAALLKEVGWDKLEKDKRDRKDFASLDNINHPAQSWRYVRMVILPILVP